MKAKIRYMITFIFAIIGFIVLSIIIRNKKSVSLIVSAPLPCRITGDKWIVTAVDSLSIKTLRHILNIPKWKVMVIGQKGTLNNWSAQFPSNKLLYLSYEEQMSIDLHTARYIIYGINAQKNIGYLVAISCGAEIIYELDHNNFIWEPDIQVHPSVQFSAEVPWIAFHLKRSPFVNIYGLFGQPQIWPRGLPLAALQNISEDGWSSFRRNDNETIKAYIQQKIVDSKPDIDAIAQLIGQTYIQNISFDHDRQPIVLESFTFSPYNSKNTIHYRDAFWGLHLPLSIHPQVADIWRSFWVQRLLWDIGGHLMFTSSRLKSYNRMKNTKKYMKDEQMLYDAADSLVRFLHTWKHNGNTLPERIQGVIDALIKASFLNKFESTVIEAWLHDLNYVKYKYPLINHIVENVPAAVRVKRAAVCVTGLTECVQEVWAKNEIKLRKRLNGDIDVFLFMSTGHDIVGELSPTIPRSRIKQARFYNATINIVHQDIVDIDPGFPSICKHQYIFTEKHKIAPIEQERYAQAICYNIVRDYEKKQNIRYQLLIRARSDSIFVRLPDTFERKSKFDVDNNIIVPDEHHYYGLNDRFAIGPMHFMKYYMSRWYELSLCLTNNVHPESFLAFVLRKNNVSVTKDIEISLVQIPHGKKQCH